MSAESPGFPACGTLVLDFQKLAPPCDLEKRLPQGAVQSESLGQLPEQEMAWVSLDCRFRILLRTGRPQTSTQGLLHAFPDSLSEEEQLHGASSRVPLPSSGWMWNFQGTTASHPLFSNFWNS